MNECMYTGIHEHECINVGMFRAYECGVPVTMWY